MLPSNLSTLHLLSLGCSSTGSLFPVERITCNCAAGSFPVCCQVAISLLNARLLWCMAIAPIARIKGQGCSSSAWLLPSMVSPCLPSICEGQVNRLPPHSRWAILNNAMCSGRRTSCGQASCPIQNLVVLALLLAGVSRWEQSPFYSRRQKSQLSELSFPIVATPISHPFWSARYRKGVICHLCSPPVLCARHRRCMGSTTTRCVRWISSQASLHDQFFSFMGTKIALTLPPICLCWPQPPALLPTRMCRPGLCQVLIMPSLSILRDNNTLLA